MTSELRSARTRVRFLCLGEHERPRVPVVTIQAALMIPPFRFTARRLRVTHESSGPGEGDRTLPTTPPYLDEPRSALIVPLARSCALHAVKRQEPSYCLLDPKRRITNYTDLAYFGGT